eukprot:PhF_6_TR31509/c0_g1_i1/m.46411
MVSSRWSEMVPGGTLFTPRQAFTAVLYKNNIFIWGGQTDALPAVADMFMFDRASRLGKQIIGSSSSEQPLARRRCQTVLLPRRGSFLILFGQAFDRVLNDVWEYNLTSGVWVQWMVSGTVPDPLSDACCVTNDNETQIYCFGGTGVQGDYQELYVLEVGTQRWSIAMPMMTTPRAPERRVAVCYLDEVRNEYVVGMGFQSTSENLNDLWSFNFGSRTWRQDVANGADATLPEIRDSAAFCTYKNTTTGVSQYFMAGGWGKQYWHNDLWEVVMNTSSGKRYWKRLSGDVAMPLARARSSAVGVGSNIYMGFGRTGDGTVLGDLWMYDTTKPLQNAWVQLASPPSATIGSRYGVSMVLQGYALFCFGGANNAQAYNDVFFFNVVSNAWGVTDVATVRPTERLNHAAIMFTDDTMVIYGGATFSGTLLGDMWLFTLTTKMWTRVAVSPSSSAAPLPRTNHLLCKLSDLRKGEEMFLVGNGFDRNGVHFDRWTFTVKAENASLLVAWSKLANEIKNSSDKVSSFNRADMSYFCTGQRLMIAGGVISAGSALGISDAYLVSSWDSESGNVLGHPMPIPVYGASGVFVKNTFYVVGGYRMTNNMKRPDIPTNAVQRFVVSLDNECSTTTTAAANAYCSGCAMGSVYRMKSQSCELCQTGTYQPNQFSDCVPCPPGTFSPIVGATSKSVCRLCPEGTFQNMSGQSSCMDCPTGTLCYIGSTAYVSANASQEKAFDLLNLAVKQTQPKDFVTGQVPQAVYYALIAYAVAMVVGLVIIFLIHLQQRGKRIQQYVTPESYDIVKKQYACITNKFLLENEFNLLFIRLGLPVLSTENISLLRKHYDEDGRGHLTFHETIHMIADFIEVGYITSDLVRTDNVDLLMQDGKSRAIIDALPNRITLRDFDLFSALHRDEVGCPIVIKKKTSGGIVSLAYVTVVIGFIILLLSQFMYQNDTEVKSSVPQVAIQDRQTAASFRVVIRTQRGSSGATCGIPGPRLQCHPQLSVKIDGMDVGGGTDVACTSVGTDGCVMVWRCNNCTLQSKLVSVSFSNYHPDVFAGTMVVSIETTAAVPYNDENKVYSDDNANTAPWSHILPIGDKDVQVSRSTVSQQSQKVFRGSDPTVIRLVATPSLFEHYTATGELKDDAKGYRIETTGVSRGTEIDSMEFLLNVGVTVSITFTTADFHLLISRRGKDSIITLLSSLLGALSGLGSIAALMCNLVDGLIYRIKQKAKTVQPHRPSYLENCETVNDMERLVGSGLSFDASQTILRVMQNTSKTSQNATENHEPIFLSE